MLVSWKKPAESSLVLFTNITGVAVQRSFNVCECKYDVKQHNTIRRWVTTPHKWCSLNSVVVDFVNQRINIGEIKRKKKRLRNKKWNLLSCRVSLNKHLTLWKRERAVGVTCGWNRGQGSVFIASVNTQRVKTPSTVELKWVWTKGDAAAAALLEIKM